MELRKAINKKNMSTSNVNPASLSEVSNKAIMSEQPLNLRDSSENEPYCVLCIEGGYDEIDYIEERLGDEEKFSIKNLGINLRNRYTNEPCIKCMSFSKLNDGTQLESKNNDYSLESTLNSILSDECVEEENILKSEDVHKTLVKDEISNEKAVQESPLLLKLESRNDIIRAASKSHIKSDEENITATPQTSNSEKDHIEEIQKNFNSTQSLNLKEEPKEKINKPVKVAFLKDEQNIYAPLDNKYVPSSMMEGLLTKNLPRLKINKYKIDDECGLLKVKDLKRKEEIVLTPDIDKVDQQQIKNAEGITPQSKITKDEIISYESLSDVKIENKEEQKQDAIRILKEAERRVNSNIKKEQKTTLGTVRRFILNKQLPHLNIETVIAVTDLKNANLIGKLHKKGRNGDYQYNWFLLKSNALTCFNGKRNKITTFSMPSEQEGDLVAPEDGRFYYTRKYSLDVNECKVYLVKNKGLVKTPLRYLMKFCKQDHGEYIEITHRTIKNIVEGDNVYFIFINVEGGRDIRIDVPILEFALEHLGMFYFFRTNDSNTFLRWILAITFRQGTQKCVMG